MIKQPSVSVIIPAYGTMPYLRKVIGALQGQTCKPLEIIISHSAADDPTADFSDPSHNVHVIHVDERRYAGAARNAGAAIAQGDWLAFIDGDVIPEPDWLDHLRSAIQQIEEAGRRACIIGSVEYACSGGYWGLCVWTVEFGSVHAYMPARSIENGPSANMAVAADDFRRAGGFREDLLIAEDATLQADLRQRGVEIRFVPVVIARHNNIAGLRHCLRHLYVLGRGGSRFRKKHTVRGSAAASRRLFASGLWLGRLVLIYYRTMRWGPRHLPRLVFLTPGLIVALIAWNAGFFAGMNEVGHERS